MTIVLAGTSGVTSAASVVGMGDSIGEGVQSADASWSTQIFTYITWVTFLSGDNPTVPAVAPNLFGVVGNPDGRPRLAPNDLNKNISVSGADLSDLLYARANALTEAQIDSELDLMLYPRLQSQMEIVEASPPDILLCWIGNNDVLSAATSFSALDASQMTSVASFDADYTLLADRLSVLAAGHGTKVALANIPNVTDIGFLLDAASAEALLGFPVSLAPGERTTLVAVFLMAFAGNDDLLADANYILDNGEITAIQTRISEFNSIIQREADRIGVPVVDVNTRFQEFVASPPVIQGRSLTPGFMQGLFSLDGVHPSITAHGLIAVEFVDVLNDHYGPTVFPMPQSAIDAIYEMDPNIDKDGDGQAVGRLGAGLMETLAWLVGFTGDTDD
ncbi:MAG: SGNH/GDSL hydrolase family protein [Pseudomonadota bacterium]